MLYRILKLFTETYLSAASDSYVKISVVFGITGINRDGYDPYKPCCNRGTAQFSTAFDLTTTTAQNELEQACNTIASYPCGVSGCSINRLAQPGEVSCWITAMKTWNNGSLPTGTAFVTAAEQFTLSDAGKRYANDIGFRDSSISWTRLRFYSTLQVAQPFRIKSDVYDVAEGLATRIASQVDEHLLPVYQDGGREWVWMTTEEGLVNGLFLGFAICFPVAFLVLIYASSNVILSLYAVVSIAFIVACVLGTVRWGLEYNLGVAECIAGIIVIGFSVDYVVHLAHMYTESTEPTSGLKTAESLKRMGHTVFAGAITTFGAGITMAGCKMMFFVKMSVLISLTIFFSLFYAFFFFIPLCALMGPYGGWGDVCVMVAKVTGSTSRVSPRDTDKAADKGLPGQQGSVSS